MDCKIYLPTIHLFAYSRKPKSDSLLENTTNTGSDWLWEHCNHIIKTKLASEFDLKSFLRTENPKLPAENLINQELSHTNIDQPDFIHIPTNIKYNNDDYFPIYIDIKNDGKAEVYARKIYDSYALCLKFYPKNKLKNKIFSAEEIRQQQLQFNPDNCLVLPQEDGSHFLGQTILITAKLNNKHKNQSSEWLKNNIADQYLESLFPKDANFRKPVFNRAGKLFGRPIFEYGIFRQLDNYVHVLIWLIDYQDEKNIIEKIHKNLLGLFFFRAKVINAYKETRIHSKQAKIKNFKIEKRLEWMAVGSAQKKRLENPYLAEIYHDLIELTQISLKYANLLRHISEHQNTISDNTRNYIDKIREIKSIFPRESLGFLILFGESTCRSFKDQIATELNSYQHTLQIIDDVINAIQGMLRIELHETEKQHDAQERKRDRNLNVLIFAAASGLGTAELVSSNFSMIEKDAFFKKIKLVDSNWIKHYPYSSVIGYSLAFSLFVGIAIWVIWGMIEYILKLLKPIRIRIFRIIKNKFMLRK